MLDRRMREGEVWSFHEKYDYAVVGCQSREAMLLCVSNNDVPGVFGFPDLGEIEGDEAKYWTLIEDHTNELRVRPSDLVFCPECHQSFLLIDHYLCEQCRPSKT